MKNTLSLIVTVLSCVLYTEASLSHSLKLEESIAVEYSSAWNLILPGVEGKVQKLAPTEDGNLILVLDQPVKWTHPEREEATLVNLLEYDPIGRKIVDVHLALADADEESFNLTALVFDAETGLFYGLNPSRDTLFAYEFLPEQEETLIVERTRMVEIEVMPEPTEILIQEAQVPPMVDSDEVEATKDAEEDSNQSAEEGDHEVADDASEKEESEGMEEALDKTDTNPIEPIELVESAVEIKPIKEWVEETYEEEITVFVNRKFGTPVSSWSLAPLELENVLDLYFDTEKRELTLLGTDESEQLLLPTVTLNRDATIEQVRSVNIDTRSGSTALLRDPLTGEWTLITEEGWHVIARQGRLLHTVSLSNLPTTATHVFGAIGSEALYAVSDAAMLELRWNRPQSEKVRRVPGPYPTIQAAIDAANPHDWILTSSGHYAENLVIREKPVRMASYYAVSEEAYFIENTIISPNQGEAVRIVQTGNDPVYLAGLQITDAELALNARGTVTLEKVELIENEAGARFAGGTVVMTDSLIARNRGDGLYYADATATLVERCNIRENHGHGIAIELTPYDGVLFRTVIRRNDIFQNKGSGIHFADRPVSTQREFRIENNFIVGNSVAGVHVFLEQPDPRNLISTGPRTRSSAFLVNNTIVRNPIGVKAGGNYRMVNNIIAFSEIAGVRDVLHHSVIIRNLFWENGENAQRSNFDMANNMEQDPLFVGDDYVFSVRSPATGAGIPGNLWNDTSDRSGANIGASR